METRSTQVHRSHPDHMAGTSLLYPHARDFPGGLHTSGFVASLAGEIRGHFDEPGLTTRCTIILSGSCSMSAGGMTHHFQTRDLVLARTASETFTFENSEGFSALEIHVPLRLLEQMKIMPPSGIQTRKMGLQDPAFKTARQLLGYLRAPAPHQFQTTSPQALVGYGLAMTMLGYAFTQDTADCPHSSKRNVKILELARKTLLEHFDRAPTITQLATLCDLSSTRFKQLFREQFGCAPYALYQRHRMEHARLLLKEKNVTETAMELGYSNVSHFGAAFQKQFGYSPAKWQKLNHSL